MQPQAVNKFDHKNDKKDIIHCKAGKDVLTRSFVTFANPSLFIHVDCISSSTETKRNSTLRWPSNLSMNERRVRK